MKKAIFEKTIKLSDYTNIEIQVVDKSIKDIETFIVSVVNYEDGSRSLHRYNKGFESYKLIGLLEYIKTEILAEKFSITRKVKKTIK